MADAVNLLQGDCLEVLPTLPADSVDSIVTDPPYGLSFMGKDWDHGVPGEHFWREAIRVAKPGAHLLAFGGTRMFHRLAVAIEDAGWEIRDTVMWVYGSGFPKSKNLDGDWQGFGTALKPAWEPIIVARKPLIGTVADNVLKHGTGAMNIDGCRIPGTPEATRFDPDKHSHDGWRMNATGSECAANASPLGRWPANLIHDGSDEVVSLFPQTKSGSLSPDMDVKPSTGWAGGSQADRVKSTFTANEGSAARFFYCAKASKRDRDEGLEGFEAKRRSDAEGMLMSDPRMDHKQNRLPSRNHHPTVKPTDLMRYLCRLVTPPGGVILDPFMGSGSTGKAAILEGFNFIGIEREAEYIGIARARIRTADTERRSGGLF